MAVSLSNCQVHCVDKVKSVETTYHLTSSHRQFQVWGCEVQAGHCQDFLMTKRKHHCYLTWCQNGSDELNFDVVGQWAHLAVTNFYKNVFVDAL